MEEREQNKLCHLFMGDLEMEGETERWQANITTQNYHQLSLYTLESVWCFWADMIILQGFTSLSDCLLLWSVCRPSMAE